MRARSYFTVSGLILLKEARLLCEELCYCLVGPGYCFVILGYCLVGLGYCLVGLGYYVVGLVR